MGSHYKGTTRIEAERQEALERLRIDQAEGERADFEERAAILEYDAWLTREEAERKAREMTRPHKHGKKS